jgi:membrane protease YdiL (CAAX protease family)
VDHGAAAGPEATRVVRWGLGDFIWIYFAGLLGSVLLGGIAAGISHQDTGALTDAFSFAGQYAGWLGGLIYVSHTKGRGSLLADFGFVVHARDAWALVVGFALSIALSIMSLPLVSLAHNEHQDIVNQLQNSGRATQIVIAIAAGFVAPVLEELMFRGLLLRALRRRFMPEVAIGISALVFALAHPLLDPHLGTFALVPALFALGAISGIAATWTGELSVSIALHIGFNLLTVVSTTAVLLRV